MQQHTHQVPVYQLCNIRSMAQLCETVKRVAYVPKLQLQFLLYLKTLTIIVSQWLSVLHVRQLWKTARCIVTPATTRSVQIFRRHLTLLATRYILVPPHSWWLCLLHSHVSYNISIHTPYSLHIAVLPASSAVAASLRHFRLTLGGNPFPPPLPFSASFPFPLPLFPSYPHEVGP